MPYTNVHTEIVAAVAANSVIGDKGRLPWHLPDDLVWFRNYTMGHTCVVGRKTFEALPPLAGRTLFVPSAEGATYVSTHTSGKTYRTHLPLLSTLEATLRAAKDCALKHRKTKVIVLGGENVFLQTIAMANSMVITHVHDTPAGDTQFPRFDPCDWDLEHEAGTANWSRVRYTRKPT